MTVWVLLLAAADCRLLGAAPAVVTAESARTEAISPNHSPWFSLDDDALGLSVWTLSNRAMDKKVDPHYSPAARSRNLTLATRDARPAWIAPVATCRSVRPDGECDAGPCCCGIDRPLG